MKHAQTHHNNKKGQKPHTNILETKTIHQRNWRNTLFSKRRTPAIAAIAAGFFIASVASASSQPSRTTLTPDNTTHENQSPPESEAHADMQTSIHPETNSEKNTQNYSNMSDVRIETKIESDTDTNSENPQATEHSVTVNGVPVSIPERGTYKQTIHDESGETTIRIRGNDAGVSLHADIKNSKEAE